MSWTKKPQGGQPPPGPDRQPYAAPQAQQYNNQQNLYQSYHTAATNTQQQFWPQQQPQFNQQYGQVYHQDSTPNANQYYQAQQNYNQYNNPQPGYGQNFYPNQPIQQQNFTQKTNSDAWEDNWDWGWDEASKQQAQKQQNMVSHPTNAQQQVFNNANVIEESFARTDSWNWSMDEKKEVKEATQTNIEQGPTTLPATNPQAVNNIITEPNSQKNVPDITQQAEEVKTLNDREEIKERLPNLALGKRFHLDNLTPQWSIESQMSQESSDGPQTHSEGTYRSENQSRNSSKSSPGLNTDSSNFNYSQPAFDEYPSNIEWSKSEDQTLVKSVQNGSRRESQDELANSLHEMKLGNHEAPVEPLEESRIIREGVSSMQPPLALTPPNFAPSVSLNHSLQSHTTLPPVPPPTSTALPRPHSAAGSLPRPPSSSGSLPRPPSSSGSLPPPPSSSSTLPPPPLSGSTLPPLSSSNATLPPPAPTNLPPPNLPPPNFPPPSSSSNPFKHAGPFSHKTTKSNGNTTPMQFPPQMANTNLTSQSVANKVSQHRVPLGFEANLETTPDNSERPDQPQMTAFRPMPVTQQVPENLEVAPQNDRNEYLQTGHLSVGDYGENTDFSRSVPPPGLRRMVVGQQETEYGHNLNMSGDEPPPGLARMVPGQQTETENVYNQPGSNYMDRQIDGQPTDNNGRPYRQADGQQTPDNYTQSNNNTGNERRPVGLDRMVPGEPNNDEYSHYQSTNYGGNEERVVTGVDHDFSMTIDAGPSDIREQNVDGSDYTEQAPRNPPRNIIGARETSNNVSPDFGVPPDDQQREVIMEGENLQDLSNIISSVELAFSREQLMDGADRMVNDQHKTGIDRKTDHSDSIEHPVTSSRRQSLNRVNTSGEESERDRSFKLSPRRDKDKHKSPRDRDRDRDRDRERDKEGRYSRGDRKYDRDERRSGRDDRRSEKDRRDRDKDRDRREKGESPDGRRHRRSNRSHRYETEDTDYYSDKERERRRYREGSYASRPPRRDDKDRRPDDKDRSRRYNTIERDRRYDDEWDGAARSRRSAQFLRYRDIDPAKKYGNLRKDRDDDRRRVVTFSCDANTNDNIKGKGEQFSSPIRPESREAAVTDDDLNESRRRSRRHQRPDPYYDGYGGGGVNYSDPYVLQPQQYQYYELLRMTDPEAYLQVYKQVMAGHPPAAPPPHLYTKLLRDVYGEGYSSLGYDGRLDKRGGTNSVHSGRSSTTGLKGNDTLYGYRHEGGSLRDAPSLRTDLSDRDLNTDASLNLQLEESTVRSERMTPFRYSTAHIKGSVSSRHVVLVRGSYPVDGLPATVQVLSLQAALAHDPVAAELAAYPGPLLKGVSHKKSVMEYCLGRVRSAAAGLEPESARDLTGYVLVWELLALLLRQNGVVVGSDIAELLMKNTREYEHKPSTTKATVYEEERHESSVSGELRDEEARNSSPEQQSLSTPDLTRLESSSPGQPAVDEKAALDRFREYLIYGNRQEALEWAMSHELWGHAIQLAAHGDRRTRATVSARFVAAQPRSDPLHTLYAALAGTNPPALTCVSEERWGDWRPHAAIILSNSSSRPEQDRKMLTQLGDSLSSRGLIYSAQFCYVAAGVPFSPHPLAPLQAAPAPASTQPPRLSLLLADSRASSLNQFATNKAIFATEIYEYARSLNQDYGIADLQVYKVVAAARLCDCGQYERALAYVEQAARPLTSSPHSHTYSPALVHVLADLADRLKYHDPALQEQPPLQEEPDSTEPSPRHHHQWINDIKTVAHMLSEQSRQVTPQHHAPHQSHHHDPHNHYGWGEQALQYQQPVQSYPEPVEETPDYAGQYYSQQAQQIPQQGLPQAVQHIPQPVGQPISQHVQQQVSQHISPQIPQQISQQDGEPSAYPSYGEDWHKTEEHHAQSYADPYWQPDTSYGYGEGAGEEPGAGMGEVRPAITMPGAKPAYRDYDGDRPPSAEQGADRNTDSPKSTTKSESKSKDDLQKGEGKQRSGWLGGILTKLSLRPPNQMILPDDKNPSIVWDEDKKRWRNVDGDTEEIDRPPPPPPRTNDLPPALRSASPPLQSMSSPAPASAAPVSNIFKMQKGRHIKKSYVDVFNPSGAATRPLPPAAEVLGPATPMAPIDQLRPLTYLVPAPAHHSAQPVQASISIPMCSTRTPTPPTPTPTSTPRPPSPSESGIYDPSQVGNEDDQYRSGI